MSVLSAIWPQLADDPVTVEADYRYAMTAADKLTMDSIEAMPGAFAGALSTNKLTELKVARLRAEDPAKADANLARAQRAEDLAGAYRSANQMLTEIEDSLPGSDAATGRRDRDGLPVADLELMT